MRALLLTSGFVLVLGADFLSGVWRLLYPMYYLVFTLIVGCWSYATYKKLLREEKIKAHLLWIGQKEKEVIASWGEPDRIKRNSDGVTVWYYSPYGASGNRFRANITFQNGRVSEFTQDQKDF